MTFREKFHKDFPKKKDFNPASKWCPSAFDYEADWTCHPTGRDPEGPDCDACWNREMPEQKIYYFCDGKVEKCRNSKMCFKNCAGNPTEDHCRHTSDIKHAKNFVRTPGRSRNFVERDHARLDGKEIPITISIKPNQA